MYADLLFYQEEAMIYFDSAATTLQKPPEVSAAVARAINTMTTPGRGDHYAARQAADVMLRLRKAAAAYFDAPDPERVILTGNATHGLNIAIKSLVSKGGNAVISGYEHNAVTRPLHAIGDVSVTIVNGELFRPDQMAEGFEKAVNEKTEAVICTHMSNVFGYELPVDDIAEICRRKGVPLIVDASQSAGILPVSLSRWKAAYVAMPGHKGLYGPQGTGLLLCGEGRLPDTVLEGGTGSLSRFQDMPDFLPDRLEAGTQNVHGAAGLLAGIQFVSKFRPGEISSHEKKLMSALAGGVKEMGGYRVYDGNGTVLSIVPEKQSSEALADDLAEREIAVRAGYHCAPIAHITAGTAETGTVRFSASAFNKMSEVDHVLNVLKRKK